MGNPHNDELKMRDLVLIKNQNPQSPLDARYKPIYQIIKKIGDKSFHVQDPPVKWKESLQGHLQVMYPAKYYVTALFQMEMFGRTAKFINNPSLMPDLYKDVNDNGHTAVDKQCQLSQLGMLPWVIQNQHLTVTTFNPMTEMLYM